MIEPADRAPWNPLAGVRVLEVGLERSVAVAGRVFADLGAEVIVLERPAAASYVTLDADKRIAPHASAEDTATALASADLLLFGGELEAVRLADATPEELRTRHPRLVVAAITPFGLTGPRASQPGTDLTVFHASGLSRLLIGQVEDLEADPPVRAAGEQSAFIGGITAATGAIEALLRQQQSGVGDLVDVSLQEALACMAIRDLASPAHGGEPMPRRRHLDGNGTTVTILPTRDGYIAISPREERQWQTWLGVMGEPAWGREPRFETKADRAEHFDELHALMSEWSSVRTRREVFEAGQGAHVPCFPLSTPADLLDDRQLQHRRFWRRLAPIDGPITVPGPPWGHPRGDAHPTELSAHARWRDRPESSATTATTARPLEGVRVLDFSWVIAGPTCTRYLAAWGAEVIKVETSARPDPGRASELHSVLGEGKLGVTLNMKHPDALEVARQLVAASDVLVENFATGVMERFGLGDEALRELNPNLVLLSASGMGRTGPDAGLVAYGTLLQSFTAFAALNGEPGRAPRIGMAWLDPMCGLMMALAVGAALLDQRRNESPPEGARIDFSMVEALLGTMPGPVLEYQLSGETPSPAGNTDATYAPHDAYRARSDDAWVALAVTTDDQWQALCATIDELAPLAHLDAAERRAATAEIDAAIVGWVATRDAKEAADLLLAAGVPAATPADSRSLFDDAHLDARGFYGEVTHPDGKTLRLPGLPWRSAARESNPPSPAPALGEHTAEVLARVLDLTPERVEELRTAGALD
jgi:crotonobetainyl-CoA:carnitine CoA-transferase CaiB-like acyl-CoA transferase